VRALQAQDRQEETVGFSMHLPWGSMKTWKMRDGKTIKICEMTDSHLANTIAFILRVARKARADLESCPPMFQGEMAQMHADQEYDNLLSMDDDDFAEEIFPAFPFLCEERALREDPTYRKQLEKKLAKKPTKR
jgi:hypothetical protein